MSGPRSMLAVLSVCVSLMAGVAGAQDCGGVDLSWNGCGAAGLKDQIFDCSRSDTTALKLYGSFVAPPGLDACAGYRIRITGWDTGLNPWWDYGTGGCREGLWSLKSNAPGPSCNPVSFALAQEPSFQSYRGEYGGGTGVVFAATAMFLEPQVITEGETYYAFTLILRRPAQSVCEGCCSRSWLTATIEFIQAGGNVWLEWSCHCAATWQGGSCGVRQVTSASNGGCQPTPTKSSTWGSLKALYR